MALKLTSLLFFFLLFLANPETTQATTRVCTELSPLSHTKNDASTTIQSCINAASGGDIIELPPGKYYLGKRIFIDSHQDNLTLRTQGKNSNSPRCNNFTTDCAELVSSTNFISVERPDADSMFVVYGDYTTLDHLALNGNQFNREHHRFIDNTNGGYNLIASGNHITFTNGIIKNGLRRGTFWAAGNNLNISNNLFTTNGIRKAPYTDFVSDGLIVGDSQDSLFENNDFVNGGTDVDMILGHCPNCIVRNNTFTRTPHMWGHTNAALMFTAWGPPREITKYDGMQVYNNKIDCGVERRCTFGLIIGSQAWWKTGEIASGGTFYNNTINNALHGFMIDDHRDAIIYNNPATNITGFVYSKGLETTGIDQSQDTIGTNFVVHDWTEKYLVDCLSNCDLPGMDAEFVSQTVPTTMVAGKSHPVSITLRNNGFYEWSTSETNVLGLGSHNPVDNGNWGSPRINLSRDHGVIANQEYTFNFNVTAPSTPDTYNFQWQMLQDQANGWFGDLTPNQSIQVTAAPSRPGDLNFDNYVNYADFSELVSFFGTKYTISDFNDIIINYGQ